MLELWFRNADGSASDPVLGHHVLPAAPQAQPPVSYLLPWPTSPPRFQHKSGILPKEAIQQLLWVPCPPISPTRTQLFWEKCLRSDPGPSPESVL